MIGVGKGNRSGEAREFKKGTWFIRGTRDARWFNMKDVGVEGLRNDGEWDEK